jgi:hypothetical protein
MLLGCCHCGQESDPPSIPSDSDPPDPSVEPSSDESIGYGIAGCSSCLENVLPTRYKVTFSKTSTATAPDCNSLYTGTFYLHHEPSGIGTNTDFPFTYPLVGGTTCRFYSKEIIARLITPPLCGISPNPAARRFQFYMSRQDLGGSFRYAVVFNAMFAVGFSSWGQVSYQMTQDDLLLPGDNAFNCLGAFTIPNLGGTHTAAQMGMPASVTVSPG